MRESEMGPQIQRSYGAFFSPLLYFSPLPWACSWLAGRLVGNIEEEEEEEEEEGINIAPVRALLLEASKNGVWVFEERHS